MSRSFDVSAFGRLVNAIGGGGDVGQSFPASDADDLDNGALFVPGEVTLARRRGERVIFVQQCTQVCWYWEMPDGTRHYHWERTTWLAIARSNNPDFHPDLPEAAAGRCPYCKNPFTDGGTFSAEEITAAG